MARKRKLSDTADNEVAFGFTIDWRSPHIGIDEESQPKDFYIPSTLSVPEMKVAT